MTYEQDGTPWPTTDLDPVRRLHALAAGVRGAQVSERLIEAPFEQVWPLLADLEGELGRILPDMRGVRLVQRDGDQVVAVAHSKYGFRARLVGTQRPGWCWLQSRFLLVGVAAVAEGPGTRVALTGGVRVPGRAALVPVGVGRSGRRSLERLGALISPSGV
ncbi:SRPBCC family protein [Streptomyces sp. T-3]|nr:SRPBCC family protein [Streptomyces sp. T-3]